MKKTLLVCMLLIAIVLSFAACGGKDNPPSNSGENGNETPVHTHSFGEWETTKNPTCTENGAKVRYCSCGENQSETIAMLGHTPVEATIENKIEATCNTDGSYDEVVYCSVEVCKAEISRTTMVIDALGHNFAEGMCNICGESDPNYAPIIPDYSVGLKYTSNGDGTCYVSGIGTCKDTDIVIPPVSPEGWTVVGIIVPEIGGFNTSTTTSISIPATVTEIDGWSIIGAGALKYIAVDKNNQFFKSVDGHLFTKDGTKLIKYATANGADEYAIPYGVTTVGSYAFYSMYNNTLKSVSIPDTVRDILGGAFAYCTGIKSFEFPDGMTTLNGSMFLCCNMEYIVIPKSVTCIDGPVQLLYNHEWKIYYKGTEAEWNEVEILNPDNYFTYITSAVVYYYSESAPTTSGNFWHYVDGVPTAWDAYVAPETPAYSVGLEYTSNGDGTCYVSGFGTCVDSDVIIPAFSPIGDKVVSIKKMVRGYDVKSIFIPEGVIEIEDYAFDCTYATKFYLPKTLKVIGYAAFYDTGYTSRDFYYNGTLEDWFKIDIKSSNGHIFGHNGGNLYLNGELLTELTIDESTNTANLSGCKSLTTVIFADGVTSIRNDLFYRWHGLDNVVIPDSVTSIGNNAFYSCDSLTSIVIPDSVTYIGKSAFSGCAGLISVTIPNSVTEIGEYAFSYCSSLTSIVIPNSVTTIGERAFSGCSTLASIVIPNSTTDIGYGAFISCDNLAVVYYEGTSNNWSQINIDNSYSYNTTFLNATRYYYSETAPTTEGNFWHYVDGVPTVW